MTDYVYRNDGKVHDYAVYYINDDGSKSAGYMESVYVFNPGETVETWSGQKCIIDFEL